MIGIVLISHAKIATETKSAVEHILGRQQAFVAVDMPSSEASDLERQSFKALVAATDMGQGVLLMVDLFGATPSNIALSLLQADKVEVVAGFNLPSVIKAVTLRDTGPSLLELAKNTVAAGQQYICLGSDFQVVRGGTSD